MRVVLQVFRERIATSMGRSRTLATTVSGGVLRSSVQQSPGTATYITSAAMPTWATTEWQAVSQCAASGINTPSCLQAGLTLRLHFPRNDKQWGDSHFCKKNETKFLLTVL